MFICQGGLLSKRRRRSNDRLWRVMAQPIQGVKDN